MSDRLWSHEAVVLLAVAGVSSRGAKRKINRDAIAAVQKLISCREVPITTPIKLTAGFARPRPSPVRRGIRFCSLKRTARMFRSFVRYVCATELIKRFLGARLAL